MSFIARNSARSLFQACRCQVSMRASAVALRYASTEAPAAKAPEAPAAKKEPVDPKITQIVDSISKLTLTETSALIKELKSTLDIPDMAFPVAGAAAPAAAPAEDGEASEKQKPKEKTIFNLKLESFEKKSKAKVIKEVKSQLGLSLIQAKKLVESAPKVLKENLSKEDAEKFKSTLEKLGAKVTLE